jgi:hypothetical protein
MKSGGNVDVVGMVAVLPIVPRHPVCSRLEGRKGRSSASFKDLEQWMKELRVPYGSGVYLNPYIVKTRQPIYWLISAFRPRDRPRREGNTGRRRTLILLSEIQW